MNKDIQHSTRTPSMFQVYGWGVCALGLFAGGCLGLFHWVFVEFNVLYIGVYSWHLMSAVFFASLTLREYRKVVKTRNQEGSGALPSQ